LDDVFVLLGNTPAMQDGLETEIRHLDGDLTVRIDEEQMKQVMFNLAINACEAMGGTGTLVVETARTGGEEVKIAFADEGGGIGDEEAARLFEPFFTTKEGGTGLGLAIANKIVEAHGGRIEAQNQARGGAEFSIVIPVSAVACEERVMEVLEPVS
jgi:signal transduction histidine kinase